MNFAPQKQSQQIATTLCRNRKSHFLHRHRKVKEPFSGKSFCKKDPSCCQKLAFDEAFRKDSNKLHLLPKSSNNLKNSEKELYRSFQRACWRRSPHKKRKNTDWRQRFGSPLTAQSMALTLKMRLKKIGCFLNHFGNS